MRERERERQREREREGFTIILNHKKNTFEDYF